MNTRKNLQVYQYVIIDCLREGFPDVNPRLKSLILPYKTYNIYLCTYIYIISRRATEDITYGRHSYIIITSCRA